MPVDAETIERTKRANASLGWLQPTFKTFRRAIYPPICQICGGLTNDQVLCSTCEGSIGIIQHSCRRCGALLHSTQSPTGNGPCIFCKSGKWRAHEVYCLAAYRHVVQSAIIAMKQPASESLCIYFGRVLGTEAMKHCDIVHADWVLSVPQHWWKRIRSRYNSSEILADSVAREIGVSSNHRVLSRVKRGQKQGTLQRSHRASNVQGAFKVRFGWRNTLQGKHVIVVDDIITTGATAAEICKVLRQSKVQKITFLAVGRGLSSAK